MRRVSTILVTLLAIVAISASSAWAALTPAQNTALKANIAASADLVPSGAADCGAYTGQAVNVVPNTSDGNLCLARLYNLAAAVDFWVWRTSVSKDELVGSTSVDGTTFNWTGTGYITRAQGERDAFNAIFNSSGFVNPSLASVRQAFADIFSGNTAPAPANRTHLTTVARRKATRAEKLFATGTGSTATPGLLVFEGALAGQDIDTARNLP